MELEIYTCFFEEINNLHPNIKLTLTHTTPPNQEPECECTPTQTIAFLDTQCEIKNGRIETDLFRKPTDKNQYLLTSSCHPKECFENIPLSLAIRINRICSEEHNREIRFQELKEMLIEREYTPGIIDAAIAKARATPRAMALGRVPRHETTDRPVYVALYDPRLPLISKITQKHHRSMVCRDQYLKDVFPLPPLIAYKRQKNIKETIIRAKVAPKVTRPKRINKGMKKCDKKRCEACPYIKTGRSIKSDKFTWKINHKYDCSTTNVVYMVECDKDNCKMRYIGETIREFKQRIYDHLGYARNQKTNQATGNHFNLPGHGPENMKFTIIEKVKKVDETYRKERERYFIEKFNTFHAGINKMPYLTLTFFTQ